MRTTQVRPTDELDVTTLAEVRAVLDDAFVDDPLSEEDYEHCLAGTQVLTREDGSLAAYAAVSLRGMLLGGTPLTVGYVEGVAVRRTQWRRGLGGSVMAPVEALAVHDALPLVLSTSDVGRPFYLARGWRPWLGRTYVITATGRRRTADEDASVMVWPSGPFADVGPDDELACFERSGDDW